MNIWFTFDENEKELLLEYFPDSGTKWIEEVLKEKGEVTIKHCFSFTKDQLRSELGEDSAFFCLGKKEGNYVKIGSNILSTSNNFFFGNDVKYREAMFISQRRSVLKEIDKFIKKDFYIGGDKWEEKGGIPIEVFNDLVKCFPKSTELELYIDKRISVILKEIFPEFEKYEEKFNRFLEKKDSIIQNIEKKNYESSTNYNLKTDFEQFQMIKLQLEEMLKSSDSIEEKKWQEQIKDIICFLYSKYIYCKREVIIEDKENNRRPDFLLIDTNGYIDILEIKKPDTPIMSNSKSYRNNYIPTRDFSGTVQQMQNYILSLSSNTISKEKVIKNLKKDNMLEGIEIDVQNPQGLLILGRSINLNKHQKKDFEIIKKQYKNITDIITYDDLLGRLNNLLKVLERKINN